jgi:membrane protein DedA with SNARE-associated domain
MKIGKSELNKSEKWFENHGTIAVFAGRMAPGIREIISIPAGISKTNLPKFILFTFAGSLIWCVSLTLVGYYIGDAWNKLVQGSGVFNILSIVIIVGILAVLGITITIRDIKNHHLIQKQVTYMTIYCIFSLHVFLCN